MDNSNNMDLMIDTLVELTQTEPAHQTPPITGLPTLKSVLTDISPLPREALFLGLADDDLPVLLNLQDPLPGPLLIIGDQACGKTNFLQTIARAVDLLHTKDYVQYCIVTSQPDEWQGFKSNQNNAGIYSALDGNAEELIQSLFTWAHHNKGEQQSILLMIDDFEKVAKKDSQVEQHLRWLLMRGPSRHVWPIVTLNASRARHLQAWMDFFHTRLVGQIEDIDQATFITGNPKQSLSHLIAGSQFVLREDSDVLYFRVLSIEY